MAASIAKEYGALAASHALPEEEAKKQALARIKALRYGETGYLVVFDGEQVLMHPIKAELVGTKIAATPRSGRPPGLPGRHRRRRRPARTAAASPTTCGPSRARSSRCPS